MDQGKIKHQYTNLRTSYPLIRPDQQWFVVNNPYHVLRFEMNISKIPKGKVYLILRHFAGRADGTQNTYARIRFNQSIITEKEEYELEYIVPHPQYFDISPYLKKGTNTLTIQLAERSTTVYLLSELYIFEYR